MIASKTYSIKNPLLKPYVEYILFNQSDSKGSSATSFANSNICLGILNNSKIQRTKNGSFVNQEAAGVHAYLSGMYLKPHEFCSNGSLDEICIDFTPLGYCQFFNLPAKKYIVEGDILQEGFGKQASRFFEQIFQDTDLENRGRIIEGFLLNKIRSFDNVFIKESLSVLESADHCNIAAILQELNCSERKLQRSFTGQFDITPKQFLRIKRFRKTLGEIQTKTIRNGLTMAAYEHGFADQSHFNKEVKSFTNLSPLKLRKSLIHIDEKVLVVV